MRVLVCGGRDFANVDLMYDVLKQHPITVIISGHATGADQMAEMWADQHGIAPAIFPADWKKHGKAAGPLRNQRMIDEGKPDLVVAFPSGKGTADMVHRAKSAGIDVQEVQS